MNLETFKARARRKLELPRNTSNLSTGQSLPAARDTREPATPPAAVDPAIQPTRDPSRAPTAMTPPSTNTAPGEDDVYGSALSNAGVPAADTSPSTARGTDAQAATRHRNHGSPSLQSLTGSKARPDSSAPDLSPTEPDQPMLNNPAASDSEFAMPTRTERRAPRTADRTTSSDEQLQHLRSLLLGGSQESQQDQVDVVYRRTQAGLNSLRRDMDAKITDLSEYIEQLEQSILNGMESHTGGFDDESYEGLSRTINAHDQRLDALDSRLDGLLSGLRTEIEQNRTADRDDVNQQILAANDRNDRLLAAVSERLESSVAGLQTTISEQLSSQSQSLQSSSAVGIADIRDQLDALIDQRVSELSSGQSASLAQLREMLLDNTGAIKAELKTQTTDQANQLQAHRAALETQFNDAISTLNNNKVSHRDLSQLLSRLADRIQQL